jgi:hypothetical protein
MSAMLLVAAMAVSPTAPRDTLNIARVGGYGGYLDGSKLVGHGSRQRYDGAEFAIDLDVVRVPSEGVGLETKVQFGGGLSTGTDRVGRFGTIDFALDASIVRTSTFGLLAGAGLGLEFGRHEFTERVRFYPLVLTRARWLLGESFSLHLNAHFAPITTAEKDRELRGELGLGYGAFIAGARVSKSWFTAGDPQRVYGELGLGAFVGAAFY